MHSLASEHLRALESLVGLERQKQEGVVGVAMGSLYQGEASLPNQEDGTYKTCFQPDQKLCVFLCIPTSFLLTPTIETVSSMISLFLALVLYPGVQRRAQAELDVVIGRDRLPTIDDRPRLPYIQAFCKELMRWQMVTPIGTIWSFSMSP